MFESMEEVGRDQAGGILIDGDSNYQGYHLYLSSEGEWFYRDKDGLPDAEESAWRTSVLSAAKSEWPIFVARKQAEEEEQRKREQEVARINKIREQILERYPL